MIGFPTLHGIPEPPQRTPGLSPGVRIVASLTQPMCQHRRWLLSAATVYLRCGQVLTSNAAGPVAPRRIALLEDDTALRAVLVELLGELDPGLELLTATTHEELMRVVSGAEVHGVIADAWGTSHAELDDAERDQIVGLARSVPLVLLTGRTWVTRLEAAELSLVALLQKPFELEALANVLALLLERATASGRAGASSAG